MKIDILAEMLVRALATSPEVMAALREELVAGLALLTLPEARGLLGIGEDAFRSLRPAVPLVTVGGRKMVRMLDLRETVRRLGTQEGADFGLVRNARVREKVSGFRVQKGPDSLPLKTPVPSEP